MKLTIIQRLTIIFIIFIIGIITKVILFLFSNYNFNLFYPMIVLILYEIIEHFYYIDFIKKKFIKIFKIIGWIVMYICVSFISGLAILTIVNLDDLSYKILLNEFLKYQIVSFISMGILIILEKSINYKK